MTALSIIIPHYNNPRQLRILLETIPEIAEIQVIVIDDNSNENIVEYNQFDESLPMREDHFFLMKVANYYRVFHFDEPMVLRRTNQNSISHSVEAESVINLFKPFIKKSIDAYPILRKYEKKAYASMYFSSAIKYWRINNREESQHLLKKAILNDKINIRYLIYFLLIALNLKYENWIKLSEVKRVFSKKILNII